MGAEAQEPTKAVASSREISAALKAVALRNHCPPSKARLRSALSLLETRSVSIQFFQGRSGFRGRPTMFSGHTINGQSVLDTAGSISLCCFRHGGAHIELDRISSQVPKLENQDQDGETHEVLSSSFNRFLLLPNSRFQKCGNRCKHSSAPSQTCRSLRTHAQTPLTPGGITGCSLVWPSNLGPTRIRARTPSLQLFAAVSSTAGRDCQS